MYKFRAGSRLKVKIDPNIVAAEINRLSREHGDRIGATEIVEAAKSKRNPLHPLFDWNDNEAAHQWRLHQARMLLAVVVRVEPNPETGKNTEVRQFVVLDREEDGRSYEPIQRVMSDPERRQRFLEQALAELEQWRERYERFVEFAQIIESIERTQSRVVRKNARKAGRNVRVAVRA